MGQRKVRVAQGPIVICRSLFSFFFFFTGGANNPFLQEQTDPNYTYAADGSRIEGDQSQYYGAGYSQAQSGYSSSGYGNFVIIYY